MAENIKKPLIRFKGFTDTWEQRKLGEIVDYVVDNRGKNPDYYCDDGIPVIDNFMIGELYPDLKIANRFIDDNLFENFIRKYNNTDDILITLVGNGIGKMSLFPNKKAVIIQNTLGFRCEHNDKKFCYYELLSKNKEIISLDRGMAQPSIRQDELLDITFYTTNLKEEKKIATVLYQLDNLITLHQRKYEKFVNVKKAMLEKMFPQGSDKTPKIRFKGFTDTWEQRKLGEIGNTYTGLSGKTKEDFGHGNAQFVTYMNVFSNPISNPKSIEYVEIDNRQNKVLYGDIFFTTSSETPEEVGMSSIWLENNENTYLNSFCFGYRLNDNTNIDLHYLAYMLRAPQFRSNMVLLAQGISRYNISKNKAMEISIDIPKHKSEQEKIGTILYQLDNLITLHQRECEKLKNIKKACLEKMFV